jgi:hypothetical protein
LLLLSPSIALIIYSMSHTGLNKSFGTTDIVFLACGSLLFAGFIINSLLVKHEPIIDLRLFGSRSFAVSGLLRFLSGFAVFGATFLVPLYCQEIRGMSALSAGLFLSLQGIGFILIRWNGKRSVLLGMALVAAGTFAFTQTGDIVNPVLLGASLVLRGTGLGAVNVSISVSAYQDLRHEDVPHASSAIRILQQLGGSFGVAIFAVILESGLGSVEPVAAFNDAFWWSIGFTVVAFLAGWLLPGKVRAGAERAGEEDAQV